MEWKRLLNKERRRKSTMSGDHRAEFERDWDRTIFSTPVKRLQDKTQVFPLDPNDAVRTRLTHSLEVSSVARGLAIKVSQWLLAENKIKPGMDRAIEAIASTCGLVHDIGNPPFGHSGEDAIRYWFGTQFPVTKDQDGYELDPLLQLLDNKQHLVNDFRHFEGNAQALRLLSKLQILADFYGLNLTYGTLSASCKYVAASTEVKHGGDHAYTKPGYFASEADIVKEIRAKTGTGSARNPITFLVEVADDAVYSVADIEDAVRKRIFTWKEVDHLLGKKDAAIKDAKERANRILKSGGSKIPKGLPCDVYASAFRTGSIGVVVDAAFEAFKKNYNAIMDGSYRHELVEASTASGLVAKLKDIARQRAYATPPNLKLELMGRKVICDLMDVFWEGAEKLPLGEPPKPKKFVGKAGALLSENYRRVFQHWIKEQPHLPHTYHRLLLVTDYISGMTDSFATKLHKELFNG